MTTDDLIDKLLPMVENKQLPVRYPDFAARLTAAMAERKVDVQSIVEFFKKRGAAISYEMVRRYALGQAMPRQAKLTLLADAVGVSPQMLVFGAGEHAIAPANRANREPEAGLFNETDREDSRNLESRGLTDGRPIASVRPILAWDEADELGEGYVLIPRLDVKFSAGNGRIVWHVDEKGQKQAFRRAWCVRLGINPDHAATIVNDGQSMEPRLIDGDSLVVDYKATQLVDGKVYAIAYQNELYVKRLFKQPDGGLLIRSDNPDKTRYPDLHLSAEDVQHVQIIARVLGVSGAV